MTQSNTETPRTPLVDAPNLCAIYSPEPIIHDVTPDSGWPLPVASLAKALELPLPSCIQTMVDSEDLSRLSSGSIRDNHRAVLDSDPQPDSSLSSNPVLLALPFVLNAARELREVMRMNRLNEPFIRPTIPIWFSLIRLLAHMCSEDLTTISDTPYILPRVAPLEPQELITDGWATALISVIVESATKDAGTKMDTTSDGHVTHESGPAEDNETVSEDGSARSAVSSRLSLDVPFAAHMLPGCGRRLCAVLPVICIADESNIYPLLTSALYQRRVWNIDEPVIGLVISRTGTSGQVYLAWLDARPEEADGLPTPNIACATSFATSSDSHPSLGLFDLGDSISALLFAQFILGISWQVRGIKNASSTPCAAPLSWRCDDPIDNIRALEDKQWKHINNIASWARDVAATSSDTHSLPPSPTLSFNSIMPAPDAKKAPSKSATSSKSDIKPAVPTPVSNSVLAGKSDVGLESPIATFVSLEFERGVVPISRLSVPKERSDFGHLHGFLAEYEDMLNFTLVEGWTAVDDLPVVIDLLHTRRHRLWKDHITNYDLEKSRLGALPDSNDPEHPKQTVPTCLDPSLAEILESRLEVILAVTYGMSLQVCIAGQRAVREAEWRHQWDAMKYRCYTTAEELVSSQVLLERRLNLSRNRAVDFLPEEDKLLVLADYRYRYCSYALQHYIEVKEHLRVPVIEEQYQEALDESVQLKKEVGRVVAQSNFANFVKDRAAQEPSVAICDSFLFVPIGGALASPEDDGALASPEHLRSFGLVDHTGEQEKLISRSLTRVAEKPTKSSSPSALAGRSNYSTEKSTRSTQANDAPDKDYLGVPGDTVHQTRAARPTLANVIHTSFSESLYATPPNAEPEKFEPPVPAADALLLPDLVGEYKKKSGSEMQAVNQTRSYLIASVTFLASIGIKDHRVFGLATNGPKGGVLMAWWATKDDRIYIIERDIYTFNISNPIDAVQFAIFLLRLRADNDKIKKRFADHKERAKTMAKSGNGFERWTKAAQVVDLKCDTGSPKGTSSV
ncbi:hypothetical protein FIBSPDRAFT_947334 [Athelia psychrophila]|uniref:Uncharacterized protein n=1 Tax=Athelia psychrophila TaxID=1759441 RepID=A0A166S2B0_9AGAM|nr:hypothetical protein FIBSPDRAFT_947334 [Fibularhizoctonia sp. CBS 109695]